MLHRACEALDICGFGRFRRFEDLGIRCVFIFILVLLKRKKKKDDSVLGDWRFYVGGSLFFLKTVDRYISWTMACYDLFDIVKSGR